MIVEPHFVRVTSPYTSLRPNICPVAEMTV